MDRSTKTFLAVFLTMGAFLVAVERTVRGAPLGDWWLPGALLLGGIISGLSARAEDEETAPAPSQIAAETPKLREWTIVTPTPLPTPDKPAAQAPALAKSASTSDDALPFDDDELPEASVDEGDPIATGEFARTPARETAASEEYIESMVAGEAAVAGEEDPRSSDYLEGVVGAVAEDDSAAKAILEAELRGKTTAPATPAHDSETLTADEAAQLDSVDAVRDAERADVVAETMYEDDRAPEDTDTQRPPAALGEDVPQGSMAEAARRPGDDLDGMPVGAVAEGSDSPAGATDSTPGAGTGQDSTAQEQADAAEPLLKDVAEQQAQGTTHDPLLSEMDTTRGDDAEPTSGERGGAPPFPEAGAANRTQSPAIVGSEATDNANQALRQSSSVPQPDDAYDAMAEQGQMPDPETVSPAERAVQTELGEGQAAPETAAERLDETASGSMPEEIAAEIAPEITAADAPGSPASADTMAAIHPAADTGTPDREGDPQQDMDLPGESVEQTAERIENLAEAAPGDDLTVIEGVGPKYREALKAAGISTYAQVAAMSEEALTEIIKNAGMRRPPSVPSWAEQAAFAARGDWEGLAALQKTLVGGRRE